jgi:hypothetical protein
MGDVVHTGLHINHIVATERRLLCSCMFLLSIFRNLSGNQLSGAYPMQFSSINSLQDLVISRNEFSGDIPEDAFVNLTQLQYM